MTSTLHSRNPCISCQQHIIFGKTKRDDCSLENHAIKPPFHAVAVVVVVVGIAWALVPFCANTKNEQIFYKRNIETFFTCSFGALFVKPFITCYKIGALFFLLLHEFLIGQTQTLCTLKVIFRSWLELTSDFLYTNFCFKSVVSVEYVFQFGKETFNKRPFCNVSELHHYSLSCIIAYCSEF